MSAVRDQVQAASDHADRTLARMAADDNDGRGLRYGRWPYLTEQLQHAVAAFNNRQAALCPHLRAPAVMHCTASEPTTLRCIPCAGKLQAEPREDRTCDRCRAYNPDGVYPGVVKHGPILMTYGLCDGCLTDVYGQGAA